ncbi:trophoblast glycoprotein-like [Pteropus vampyrus]|uniref:Trophoblast glycoprotein-like n=1 Tax=Pteropus vampyrus TaxID=132908 RepID=A0A6P3QMH1_PTEVA|nr:trophoblast glycoprotein-like [Pteropus vampyrus]
MAPRAGQLEPRGPLLPGLLLVAAVLSQPAAPCPFQCYCFGGPKLLLRCASGAELRQPPRDVPPDARNLTIVGANLTVLRASAFNPLRCGCAARPLLAWLRNATERVPDARRLRCGAPRALHDLPFLDLDEARLRCADRDADGRGEEVELAGPELEASYVFFGLVLALIGLIFLMVLYLNRRGIQRWMRNLREACRDQMEGYHYRYEQDADPRRVPAAAAPSGSRATSPSSGL